MKKRIAFLLILILLLAGGCTRGQTSSDFTEDTDINFSKKEPVAEKTPDEKPLKEDPVTEPKQEPQTEPKQEPQTEPKQEPQTVALTVEKDVGGKMIYTFENEDSRILADMIKKEELTDGVCLCRGDYYVILDGEKYNIKAFKDDDDAYVRKGSNQRKLTEEERDTVLAVFKRNLTKENRTFADENFTYTAYREGKWYRFGGQAALDVADLVESLEFTDTTDAYTAPVKVGDLWVDLSAKQPYVFNWAGKVALLGAEAEKLETLLDQVCVEANYQPPFREDDTYVVIYGVPNVQYRFKNEDNRKINNWLANLRFGNDETTIRCNCRATYRLYTNEKYYLSVQQDGSGHLYNKENNRHLVISKEHTQQLVDWFTPHCLKENEVPYYG